MALNPVLTGAPSGFCAAPSSFGLSADNLGECPLHAPAALEESVTESRHTDAGFVAPLSKRLRLARMCQVAIVRPVEHLGSPRCPTHIAGLVAPIIVDSVKSMTRWTMANLGKKAFKGFEPRRHGDSSCAVAVIPVVARIGTPRPHVAPRRVFGCVFHPVCGLRLYQSLPGYMKAEAHPARSKE